jgi:DNA segregation ATPase FtsK/SpoIIIE, S-DNA-T family
MPKKNADTKRKPSDASSRSSKSAASDPRLHPDTMRSIWAIGFVGIAILLTLAGFDKAGPAGSYLFAGLSYLVGWGYAVLPIAFLIMAGEFLFSGRQKVVGMTLLGSGLMVLSVLALIEVFSPTKGGILGLVLGSLRFAFGDPAAVALNSVFFVIAILIVVNTPIRLPRWEKKPDANGLIASSDDEPVLIAKKPKPASVENDADEDEDEKKDAKPAEKEEKPLDIKERLGDPVMGKRLEMKFKDYVPPPLELLKSSVEKPTTGDLRANANIIKRTLESFGIMVEMGEINIGPKVTRYTLKPAEGVKLSRIEALSKDLSLALAAHPLRIEAPIPGKSLVGIEVPNKQAAVVRLGSMLAFPDFNQNPLSFALGRDVTGDPIFANVEKMPHMLVAGATGSGKSVTIHSLLISLLYKNSPASLRLILIDPKRVELTAYQNIPHLVSPVITESKKSVGVFRWAIGEMDRRYEMLQQAGSRDIKSYNAKTKEEPLPYIVIVVDELADIMTTYGREVEGSIVRLAQMARATGIHLVLATQRPSVEVITGLIKANITSRIALQVASQIDSRTILDTAGAEKLLGGGDLLQISAELSKPKRIQGSYISEEEIHKVTDFIRENNKGIAEEVSFDKNGKEGGEKEGDIFSDFADDGDSDDMYDEAVQVVAEAQKASASLLQRRLKVGYARAARLLDLMESKGVIGPGDGAKPREVFMDKPVD